MNDYLTSLKKIYDSGYKREAIDKLMAALKRYPKWEDGWILLASFLEKPENKYKCYEKTLEINPNNSVARYEINRLSNPETVSLQLNDLLQNTPSPKPTHQPNQVTPPPQYSNPRQQEEKPIEESGSFLGSDKFLKWVTISAVAIAGIIIIMLGILILNRNTSSNNPTNLGPAPLRTKRVLPTLIAPTTNPCGINEIQGSLNNMQDLARQFIDLDEVGRRTPFITLASQINQMQTVRRQTEDLIVPACVSNVKAQLLDYMNTALNGYNVFLASRNNDEALSILKDADDLLSIYQAEFAKLQNQ